MSGPMTGRSPEPGQEGSRAGRRNGLRGLGHVELKAFMKCTRESSSRPWETQCWSSGRRSGPKIYIGSHLFRVESWVCPRDRVEGKEELTKDRSNSSLWRAGGRRGPKVWSEVGRSQGRQLLGGEGWKSFLGERSLP